jgi:hypothetical protein
MKKSLRLLTIVASALCALAASSHAQTYVFNGAGSSAAFLELGEASASSYAVTVPAGTGDTFQCVWSAASGAASGVSATDGTTTVVENGASWVAWKIDTTGGTETDCSTPGPNPTIDSYESTDSVVGNRLLFNNSTTVLGGTPGTTAKSIYSAAGEGYTNNCSTTGWDTTANPTKPVEICTLPAAIVTFLQTAHAMTAAGTDIRPEDAVFATLRDGGTACGAAVAGSQYLGLGYGFETSPSNLVQFKSYFGGGPFNVTNFTLPASYSVYRLGAAPILVHVNQMDGTTLGAGHAGFGDTNITNITSGELANFLDGTYSRTGDMGQASGTSQPVTVLVREALSGTYNTMEYNVPNTVENQTSIDVGVNQQSAQVNCSGTAPSSNPLNIATLSGGARQRVIGTGEMENVMFGTGTESNRPTGATLGWSFWSRPNFQNAYSGTNGNASTFADARYLTVDGVDPLMVSYGPYTAVAGAGPCVSGTCPAGTIPTLANGGLSAVTFPHVIDGSYPIWSFLRLVCIGNGTSAACTQASNLASGAQSFIALGSSVDALHPPDFVPVSSSTTAWNSVVVRSHFTPPGTTIKCTTVANGTTLTAITAHKAPECGGDVGGVVFTITGDIDYETDFQTGRYVGEINHRR